MMRVIYLDFFELHITRVIKELWISFQPNSASFLQKEFASLCII